MNVSTSRIIAAAQQILSQPKDAADLLAASDSASNKVAALLQLLLKPKDAANLMAISQRTLYSLTVSGEIRCVRIGRAVRYAVAEIERFVAERQGGAA